MTHRTVSPSTVLPLTLEEVKEHLRVDGADEDSSLFAYLRAETEWCEGYLGRSLITQTRDLFLDAWPSDRAIEIPRPPLQSVTSVTYTNQGTTQYSSTYASSNYIVDTDTRPGRIVLKVNRNWPSSVLERSNPIRVRYVSGYGQNGSDVPERIRAAILLNVGDAYNNRENETDARMYNRKAAERLLAPIRVASVP